jgi:GxxExxY protein
MPKRPLIHESITQDIIGAFYEVYNILGYGFVEQVYKLALELELRRRGHVVAREVGLPVYFKGELLCEQRIDLLVDERVVVEVKASPTLPPTGARQTLNYLRGAGLRVGMLLHFGPEPKFFPVVNARATDSAELPNWDRGEREIAESIPGSADSLDSSQAVAVRSDATASSPSGTT